VAKWSVPPAEVIRKCRVVAVVGASKNPEKEAHSVPLYLRKHGFTIIPVNPTTDSVDGVKAYPSIAQIPLEVAREVEVVEVFRPSEELPDIARQAAEMKKRTGRPLVFWAQQGLESEDAKRILTEASVDFVMDACMRTVHQLQGQG
jgi:predicted CoA-binding protein